MTTGSASEEPSEEYPKSPVYELDEGAQQVVRQMLELTPTDDLEEALLPYELNEISLVPHGPPFTPRQWYLVQKFHGDERAVIERLRLRMPTGNPDDLGCSQND